MRKIIFAFLFFVLINGFIWGQRTEPAGFISSPTSTATMGLFQSPADYFINTSLFPKAEVENWFSYASFYEDFNVTMGYARRFGGIYVGLYYGGTLFRGLNDTQFTERTIEDSSDRSKDIRFYTDADPDPVSNVLRTDKYNDNRFAVLIGLGRMGFRFSFATNYDSFSGNDLAFLSAPTVIYSEYIKADGWFSPQIQWGLTQPLLARGIKPVITFELGFARHFERFTMYEFPSEWSGTGENTIYSQNFVQPRLDIGLGGYTLTETERFTFEADLGYNLLFRTFNNNFSWTSDGINFDTKPIKGFNSPPPEGAPPAPPGTLFLTERGYSRQNLIPSITAEFTGSDRIAMKARLHLQFGLGTERITNMFNDEGHLEKHGDDLSTIRFSFQTGLSLGMQYQLLPGRLILNAGGTIQAAEIAVKTGSVDVYDMDTKEGDTTVTRTTTCSPSAVSGLFAGVTWRLTNFFTLEGLTGIAGANEANLFGFDSDTDNLTFITQILATLKF